MKVNNNILALRNRTVRVKSVWRYLPDGIYYNPFFPDKSESKEQKDTPEIKKSSSNIVDTRRYSSNVEKVVDAKEISVEPVISLFAKAKRDGVKDDMDNTLEFASNDDINTLDMERPEYSFMEDENKCSSPSLQSPVSRLDRLLTRIIDDPKLDSLGKIIIRRKLSMGQVMHLTEGELRILGIKDYATLKLILKFLEEMRESRDDIVPQELAGEMNFDDGAIVMNTCEDIVRGLTRLTINDAENFCDENSDSSNLSDKFNETLPFTPNDENMLEFGATENDALNHTIAFHAVNPDETSGIIFSEYSPMTSLLKSDCHALSENSCLEIIKSNADIEKDICEIELGSLCEDTHEQPPVIEFELKENIFKSGKNEKMTFLKNNPKFETGSLNWKLSATALAAAFFTGMITNVVLSRK